MTETEINFRQSPFVDSDFTRRELVKELVVDAKLRDFQLINQGKSTSINIDKIATPRKRVGLDVIDVRKKARNDFAVRLFNTLRTDDTPRDFREILKNQDVSRFRRFRRGRISDLARSEKFRGTGIIGKIASGRFAPTLSRGTFEPPIVSEVRTGGLNQQEIESISQGDTARPNADEARRRAEEFRAIAQQRRQTEQFQATQRIINLESRGNPRSDRIQNRKKRQFSRRNAGLSDTGLRVRTESERGRA